MSQTIEFRYTSEPIQNAVSLFVEALKRDKSYFNEDNIDKAYKTWLPLANSGSPISFIDHATRILDASPEEILAAAGYLTKTPVIDTTIIPPTTGDAYNIEGLPLLPISKNEHGSVTLLHCTPFLEKTVDTTALANLYDAIHINFVLTHPEKLLHLAQQSHDNGRLQNMLLEELDSFPTPNFESALKKLESLGLYKTSSNTEETLQPTREQILQAVKIRKPKPDENGEVEWANLILNLPYIHFPNTPQVDDLTIHAPVECQKAHNIIPICKVGKILTIATGKVLHSRESYELTRSLPKGTKVLFVLTEKTTIQNTINAAKTKILNVGHMANKIHVEETEVFAAEKINIDDLLAKGESQDASIVELVQTTIVEAIQAGASDIHIAPNEHETRIRYRIDGLLHQVHRGIPTKHCVPIMARIKVLTRTMKMQYTPVPQDGKFSTNIEGQEYDMRVNITPTIYGEEAVIRIQKKNTEITTLQNLGYNEYGQNVIKAIIGGDHGLLLICGPTGSGKCLGKGTPVLKFDGTIVPVEDIKIGDLLMGPDGKPRQVLSTNTGRGPLYNIQPKKGDAWVCNDVHVMTLKHTAPNMLKPSKLADKRRRNEGIYQAFGIKPQNKGRERLNNEYPEIVDVSLKDFLARTPKSKKPDQHWKLFRTGVDFQTSPIIAKIPSDYFYYLGLWLGDGATKVNEITAVDEEIISWVKAFAAKYNMDFFQNPDERYPHIFTIGARPKPLENVKHHQHPEFPFLHKKSKEENYNLYLKTFLACNHQTPKGKHRPTLKQDAKKSVAHWALTATKTQRLALLAGLLDSDGSLNRNCFDFTNKEKDVVNGIIFLARSLGLWANPPKEKVINGMTYWRTSISGHTDKVPTLISRKKAKPRRQKKDVLKTGWTPTPLGNGEFFGFTLDSDGRFLLGDFTVTHNTTTLQTVMGMIDRNIWKVVTGEAPVEIRIPGVEQTPVEGDLTFGEFVRAALRRDPDYIMIGETRDRDTAQEAIRASITGHIVFTTLHSNSSYGAPGRIMDLGAEPFLLTDALKGVCAQRLIRKVCPSCQKPVPIPNKHKLQELGIKEEWLKDATRFYKGAGCKHCFGSGSKGRIAAVEAFLLNEEMRKIIMHHNADSSLLRKAMEDIGGKTIFQTAVEYAAQGICSLDEALAVNSAI
jgi:type II secretory ATPase GspE/PulE/Tfp pilus assembly ATPase PilB-like protein